MRLHPQVLQIITYWGDGSHTSLYFIEGEVKAIIDTGTSTSPERDIAPYLAYFGYKLDDIDVILNTHGHFDHADGNPAIPRAAVWMHEEDIFLVEDAEKAFDLLRRPPLQLMGKGEAQVAAERNRFVSGFKQQKVARALKDGDVLDLGKGIRLRVVHLPGHTMGSVGYLWEEEGMLFMGDSAMAQGSRPGILPVLFYPLAYARTLQKLQGLPVAAIATAHNYIALRCSALPIKKGAQINTYFQDCQEVNNRIMEAMGRAIHRHWGAPFPVVMEEAVEFLSGRLFLRREPNTGLPLNAAPTLTRYYGDILASL